MSIEEEPPVWNMRPPHNHSWVVISIADGPQSRPIEVVCECGTAYAIGGRIKPSKFEAVLHHYDEAVAAGRHSEWVPIAWAGPMPEVTAFRNPATGEVVSR